MSKFRQISVILEAQSFFLPIQVASRYKIWEVAKIKKVMSTQSLRRA